MGNINLSTAEREERAPVPYKGGIISVVAVVIILAAAYAGLYYYQAKLIQENNVLQAEFSVEKGKLNSEKSRNVVALQDRLNVAKGLAQAGNVPVQSLYELEKIMVPGNSIVSYAYDNDKDELALSCVAENFSLMARQILSFDNSSFFSGVHPEKSGLNDDKKVDYSIVLNLN